MDIELYWPDGMPDPRLEAEVIEYLRWLQDGDKEPLRAENLAYCCIPIGPPGDDGPCVKVWGVEGDHRFWCQYSPVFAGIKFHKSELPQEVQDKFWPPEDTE